MDPKQIDWQVFAALMTDPEMDTATALEAARTPPADENGEVRPDPGRWSIIFVVLALLGAMALLLSLL
jgi:hypothetical protein